MIANYLIYFLLIIKSKPRSVLFESTSFFTMPFLNKLMMIIIDSKKIEIIENISIIILLVIEFLSFGFRFLFSFFFILVRPVMS